MSLPQDFSSTLAQFQAFGILDENSERIENRLVSTVETLAVQSGQLNAQDLGVGDWGLGMINKAKAALHKEMCDPQKKALKDDYQALMNKALSPEGVTAVGAVVVKVVAVINPTLAVSSVVIYLSIWLLKRGLNHWCSLPE